MATCSSSHSNPKNQIYSEEREAPFVSATAAALLFAVITAVICVAVTFAISDSRAQFRRHSSDRPAARSARPDQPSSNDRAADLTSRAAPRGTDLKGFPGYPGARCNSANPAVAPGRTPR
jgi:hypothetical protein